MTASHGSDQRHVVPRWRPFGLTVRTGELASLQEGSQTERSPVHLDRAIDAFLNTPGTHAASEVLGQAIAGDLHHDVVDNAAICILDDENSSDSARRLAQFILTGNVKTDISLEESPAFDRQEAQGRIARLRAILRDEPKNAIRWADLALSHANLGALEAAEREIRTAVALAPSNRHVLRSAVRLFTLRENPEGAHAILTADADVLHDPWLLSAELATAQLQGRSSRHLRRARAIIERAQFSPQHLSELAGELATHELHSGNMKQARRYMRVALLQPTDNALAQAEWAANYGIDRPHDAAFAIPLSFEARARSNLQHERFDDAVFEGRRWQADQPFAPEPAAFTSFIAAIGTEDYRTSAAAAKQGLVANPDSLVLRNNLVFSLANIGEVHRASEELSKLMAGHGDARQTAIFSATAGLVAFRQSDFHLGREKYRQAVSSLRTLPDDEFAALTAIFWAREEIVARTNYAETALIRANGLAKRTNSREVRIWLERLRLVAERLPPHSK